LAARKREEGRGLNQLGMMYLRNWSQARSFSCIFILHAGFHKRAMSSMNNLGTMMKRAGAPDSGSKEALSSMPKPADLGNQLARDNLQSLGPVSPSPARQLLPHLEAKTSVTVSLSVIQLKSSMSGKPSRYE
jgi:hypothetical protein